ncbi:Dbl homology domain-containing [Lecanosticta acicola]|uniref:Dbl homology domain-containing n=1 Tax=Lecanosticta acicola TaxID=111012 RepID=A0AAI8YWE7_9PEZI|nr:Dbl homology domain-containing [Lecanosticta acicola]
MAHMLSLSSNTPTLNPLANDAAARSCSSVPSAGSSGTVQHNRLRSISTSSLSSVGSYFISSLRRHTENASTPSRSTSSINFNKVRTQFDRTSVSAATSRRTSFASSAFSGRVRSESISTAEPANNVRLVGVAENDFEASEKEGDALSQAESGLDEQGEDDEDTTLQLALETPIVDEADSVQSDSPSPPFRRWVSKLRRKRRRCAPAVSPRRERWTLDDFDSLAPSPRKRFSTHRKSNSQTSSLRFVTAIRSATATLASASIATVSRRTGKWRRGQQRSSILSDGVPRPSVDSARSAVDEAAKQRSRKRREKLEELIRTEESYVADLKALSDAYFTILGHQQTSTSFARPSAQKSIAELLHLHDNILGELQRVVPFAEYDQSLARAPEPVHTRSHTRWHSVDVVPQRVTPTRAVLATIRQGRRSLNISRSSDDDPAILRCSPQVVAAVTKVFGNHMERFSAYEDYGANYELVQRDIDETQRSIPIWQEFDKAIEALSAHVNPMKSREANRKRAMTVKDLLIKPVQRIPRYELLFNDLCKLTPVCDDPIAHTAVGDLCTQLNNACQRMNQAKDNPNRARTLETTWLIRDRLNFSSQVPRSVYLQLLGQVNLCGCLHIAYRSRDRIKGSYVVCVLFETSLLLATANEDQPKYSVLAGIALANATIEEIDNQKGLQCHTAPHSWKVVFEHAARMYELVFTACTAVEAEVWRSHIASGIVSQTQAVAQGSTHILELQSPLTGEMKSIGKALGKPGSFVRRMSVHRAATVGPTTELNQIIIKNTQAMKEVHQENESQASLQIPRSQSVQTPSHVQTLAPRRADRHRLETMLSDVWSKGLLPYPGMARRSDPIRAGANHVIRKFSMASITSNFSSSKRTPSYTSIASSRKEDIPPSIRTSRRDSRAAYPGRPPVVNFHNAPDAFLPADFELQDPGSKRKRSALRTFTMTMERPFSPLSGNETKAASLRRAQSVRDVTEGSSKPPPSPVPPPEMETKKPPTPVYSVVQERAKTPAALQVMDENANRDGVSAKTPRKSKSRMLLRLFG